MLGEIPLTSDIDGRKLQLHGQSIHDTSILLIYDFDYSRHTCCSTKSFGAALLVRSIDGVVILWDYQVQV